MSCNNSMSWSYMPIITNPHAVHFTAITNFQNKKVETLKTFPFNKNYILRTKYQKIFVI